MANLQKINELRNLESQISISPDQLKTAALNTVHDAMDTIKGSGSISEEIAKVGKAYLDIPFQGLGGGLKACGQMLTLHPVNATVTTFKALTEATKDIGKICVAPFPLGVAAAQQSLQTASNVAKLPVKAGKTVIHGGGRLLDLLEDNPITQAVAANDNAAPDTAQKEAA